MQNQNILTFAESGSRLCDAKQSVIMCWVGEVYSLLNHLQERAERTHSAILQMICLTTTITIGMQCSSMQKHLMGDGCM